MDVPALGGEEVWGEMKVRSCPSCGAGSGELQAFDEHQDDAYFLRYSLCRRCGLVYQDPRPSQASLDGYYREVYHQEMAQNEEGDQRNIWVQERRAEHLLSFLKDHVPSVQRHLDLGSSRGALMRAIRREYGAETIGVEPGENHRSLAREEGLQVVPNLGELPPRRTAKFDLISLSHVLEHVVSPGSYLRELRATWSVPDGLLLVEVPSLYWHPAFERAHLSAFTPSSLCQTLEISGFQLIAMKKHGLPYSRSIPLFLLALARHSARETPPTLEPTIPLIIKIRRRAGLLVLRAARWGATLVRPEAAMQPWSDSS